MGGIAFLEILDSRHHVRDRIRVDSFPVVIGRSFTSDVILDDPYVCPSHAQVTQAEDGGFSVEDLGSVNGLFKPRAGKPLPAFRLKPGDSFRIGRTTIRFCTPAQEVAETLTEGGAGLLGLVFNPALAVFTIVLGSIVFTGGIYLSSYNDLSGAEFLFGMIAVLMLFTVWAGLWSFGTRLVSSQFRFIQHLVWAIGIGAIMFMIDGGLGYVGFILSTDLVGWIIFTPLLFLLSWLFFYGHLSLASNLTRKVKHITTGVIIGIFLTLGGLTAYATHSEFSDRIIFDSTLRQVSARMVRAQPAESFFADLTSLKSDSDEEADSDR